jgi:hypothetical protein
MSGMAEGAGAVPARIVRATENRPVTDRARASFLIQFPLLETD